MLTWFERFLAQEKPGVAALFYEVPTKGRLINGH